MDAAAWNERYRSAELVWGAEPNQFVRQQCQGLAVGDAVDLGCGEGRNALWLARLGWHVLGVDCSDIAIERARSLTAQEPPHVAHRIVWRVGDVTIDPPRRSSADLVVISYLHLPPVERHQVVASAARAVRPDGHLVIVGHDGRNLTEGIGGPQDASLLYVPATVATLVSTEGLLVEVADTVERATEQGVALDTLVRARRPSPS
ncbi:MAG: class I SAM-dependent methyltransferase [Propionibacteriales bacterium]|nr:class I SAM-dependent methyltransferase [Propionibacteriales bacterium]